MTWKNLSRMKSFNMRKVIAIGVKEVDEPLFEKVKVNYPFEFKQYSDESLIKNEDLYEGVDYVISGTPTYKFDEEYFAMLERKKIKLFIAKMTGVGNIDLNAASKHDVTVANVQGYSPNAISELALSLALSLNRNLFQIEDNLQHYDFRMSFDFFKEIRDCVVGIYGVGRIGATTAKMFSSIGSKVIGCDPFPRKENEQFMKYIDISELKKESDILILHSPYIKGENYHIIDYEFISGMKKDVILINVARGELVDLSAVNKAIKENRLLGYGCDVLENEQEYFGKKVSEINDSDIKTALSLYPKIIITPHVGAHTLRAREAMVDIAFSQISEFIETGSCRFKVN